MSAPDNALRMPRGVALDMEDRVAEVEGVLKLLGEAYQQVVEEDHNEGSAALGLQLLRIGAVDRLRASAEAALAAFHLARRDLDAAQARVAELEAAAPRARRSA